MSESNGWREEDDPDVLAAAVAAGVEVQRNWGYGWQPGTNNETAEQFAGCTKANLAYRVPASWSWSYEPPTTVTGDDLRDAVHLLDLAWGVIANADGWGDDTSWRQAAERWRDGYHRLLDDIRTTAPAPPPVPPWPDGVLRDAANRLRWIANSGYIEDPGIKRIIRSWADELDATLVPPWPGAVLSGLTDEDGVPTWLAQAGQVRGEQVRRRSDFMWVNNDQMVAHLDTVWVEVRAPRAVPEPETERVQLGVAVVGGLLAICREGGTLDLGRGDVRIHTENGALVASTSESMFTVEIDPDGTVEVLKDSDR